MTLVVDPACRTCHGRGEVFVDDGDDGREPCPACRLRSRYVNRYCDQCSEQKPIAGMTFAKGELTHTEYAICAECMDRLRAVHEAAVEAEYRA